MTKSFNFIWFYTKTKIKFKINFRVFSVKQIYSVIKSRIFLNAIIDELKL